jgi:hypothetical protein
VFGLDSIARTIKNHQEIIFDNRGVGSTTAVIETSG